MVNDVILTPDAAWFTDSFQPQLYRLALDRTGEPAHELTVLPLTGDWAQGPDLSANGIERTRPRPSVEGIFRWQALRNVTRLCDAEHRCGLLPSGESSATTKPVAFGRSPTCPAVGRIVARTDLSAVKPAGVIQEGVSRPCVGRELQLPNARFDAQPKPGSARRGSRRVAGWAGQGPHRHRCGP